MSVFRQTVVQSFDTLGNLTWNEIACFGLRVKNFLKLSALGQVVKSTLGTARMPMLPITMPLTIIQGTVEGSGFCSGMFSNTLSEM